MQSKKGDFWHFGGHDLFASFPSLPKFAYAFQHQKENKARQRAAHLVSM